MRRRANMNAMRFCARIAVCFLALICAHMPLKASRQMPRITPYHEALSQCELVMIGRVLSTEIAELRDIAQLEPTALPEVPIDPMARPGLEPSPPLPHLFSWDRRDLQNPEQLWALRARVRILHAPNMPGVEQKTVLVDLGYGRSEAAAAKLGETGYARPWTRPDSLWTFHLKALERRIEGRPGATRAGSGVGATRSYELVLHPWIVDGSELPHNVANLQLRFARYDAFQQIEAALERFETLGAVELDELYSLTASSRSSLGDPVWGPGEREQLDDLIRRTQLGQASPEEWRAWWSANRNLYVDAPFRIHIDRR